MLRPILVACLALAFTPAAAAYHVASNTNGPAWLDGPAIVPTILVVRDDDPPPPEPDTCPDRPHGLDPIPVCPVDPGLLYAWELAGGEGEYPDSIRCNYDSGYEGDPCPHSTSHDTFLYVRCDGTGDVALVNRYSDLDDPTRDTSDENAWQTCPDGWVDLSYG